MDAREILIKIRKIVRSIDIESKKIQKEHGVTIPQVLCLNFLKDSPGNQTTQAEIKKFLNLNSSTVSGIIDRLDKKGYLTRLPKSGDRRVVNIALTSAGEDLLRNVPPLLHEKLSSKLEKLDESEILKVESSLEILVQLLNIEALEASPVITLETDIESDMQVI